MAGLLRGVKVVEAAVLLVGDYLGMLLGDEGADVVKLESPGRGDYIRDIMGQLAPGNSPAHVMVNRNKRSLTLDMTSPEGRPVFERLVRDADVFITGHIADTPARLGMDYDTVKSINPQIVYCQATGFGAEGPYAGIPTHGVMMESLGGAPTLGVGHDGRVEEQEPGMPGHGIVVGPLFAAYGVAAALVRRHRTGEGCYIDVSCSDAVVAASWPWSIRHLNRHLLQDAPNVPDFPEDSTASAAKYTYYQTADERYVLFCCIEEKFWRNFCEAAERPDLVDRHDTKMAVDYGEGDLELMDELQRVFRTRTLAEWTDLFIRHDVAASPAVTIDEAARDPHLAVRSIVVTEEHPAIGEVRTVGNPLRVPGEPFAVTVHAPRVGEHTDEVLAELGYTEGEIAALRAASVV